MPVFKALYNIIKGEMEWGYETDDYDFKQEIARSGYTDMLLDHERNEKYYKGLQDTMQLMRKEGKEVHVLDIGTGTGLLSMMAASLGADSVVACESFKPMAEVAKRIIAANGFSQKIKVIEKDSCDILVGPGLDMEHKANLLVTEVFDTELIGEGALKTFKEAQEKLLMSNARVVPTGAVMYVELVKSEQLRNLNNLKDMCFDSPENSKIIRIPISRQNCPGNTTVHDIQLSQIKTDSFCSIAPPVSVFKYDWTGRTQPIKFFDTTTTSVIAKQGDTIEAIFVWWDLYMGPGEDQHLLSCAPWWAHPEYADKSVEERENIPWRDHWMQQVQFLPKPLEFEEGQTIYIHSYQNELCQWFDVSKSPVLKDEWNQRCTCRLHYLLPRSRFGLLNDQDRIDMYSKIIKKHINPSSVCLFIGDLNIYGLMASLYGAKHVYLTHNDDQEKTFLEELINENNLQDRVTVISNKFSSYTSADILPITFAFVDPFFRKCLLPWENIHGWYALHNASHLLSKDCECVPNKFVLKCLPVKFKDLAKIRTPVKTVYGFNIEAFDELREKYTSEVDNPLEPQPLWEYPCEARGEVQEILSIDLFKDCMNDVDGGIEIINEGELSNTSQVNGVAVWVDWLFEEKCITTGLVEIDNGKCVWTPYVKQAVHLFRDTNLNCLRYHTSFSSTQAKFKIHFQQSADDM